MRPRTGPATIAMTALLMTACGEREGVATTIVTGVTSNVTTLTPDGTSTSSTGGSTADSSGSDSSGDASTTTTTTTGGTSTSTGVASTTGVDTTTDATIGTTGTTGTTGDESVEECLANVDPGDECTACICTDCLTLWHTCHTDLGCAKIQECAQKQGCYGFQCFTDCQSIVLLYGGPYGESWELWSPLTECLKATCRPLCPW